MLPAVADPRASVAGVAATPSAAAVELGDTSMEAPPTPPDASHDAEVGDEEMVTVSERVATPEPAIDLDGA